jgi:phospholipase A-2-activating protein
MQLKGHSKNVCALDCGSSTNGQQALLSGSWDQYVRPCFPLMKDADRPTIRSAVVWQDLKPTLRLESHLQAVWDVKCVPGDRYLTASADKLIRLYSATGSLLRTYAGHSDCVRSLALTLDGTGFWSAGNDA